ncbi:unnamed protein product [Bathycoccus prasinos]
MSNASTSVLSSFAIRGGGKSAHVSPTRPRGKKSSSRRGEHEDDENDHAADLPPPSRAEHSILAWISINPSVKRLCGYGLEPFQEEIRFLLEGLLWREIQKWNDEEDEDESSSQNAIEGGGRRRVWVKGILVRAMMVFFILYPNYVVLATCAVFVRASLRARRRASLERRRNTKQKKKKKNKEEEDVVVPRMSAYGVIVLETIADRLETIVSIASRRDPLALRVACFACAWLFVLSFFVSFSAWFAAVALFATKPKGAKRVLEACFR